MIRTLNPKIQSNNKITVRVLASSSKGNATLVTYGNRAIMVDCGLTLDYMSKFIAKFGDFIPQLEALIITHAHIDHAGGTAIRRLAENNVAVYCHAGSEQYLTKEWHIIKTAKRRGVLKTFDKGSFETEGFAIKHFQVDHDAGGYNCGFCIFPKDTSVDKKITIATDLGTFDTQLLGHFIDSDVIVLESNYDHDMLMESTRPYYLKERIKKTHLSNKKCAQAVDTILNATNKSPKSIFLAHISDQCNTPEIAYNETKKVIAKHGSKQIQLVLSHKNRASDCVVL